jgi:hypothetical protein
MAGEKKITQMTAADVADLGALTSFFEVTVDALVVPLTRKIGLGKIATWLATIGLAASNVLAAGVTVTQGTITDQAAGYTQSVTWNDVADTFMAQTLDVTDTASAAGSLLARWRVGGVTQFSVSKAGALTAGAASFTTGAFSGDFAVAVNKFTVAAATGNTVVAGTLTVSGATIRITTGDLQIVSNAGYGILSANSSRAIAITNTLVTVNYAATFASTVDVTGNLSVGTKVFTFGANDSGGAGYRTVTIQNA